MVHLFVLCLQRQVSKYGEGFSVEVWIMKDCCFKFSFCLLLLFWLLFLSSFSEYASLFGFVVVVELIFHEFCCY